MLFFILCSIVFPRFPFDFFVLYILKLSLFGCVVLHSSIFPMMAVEENSVETISIVDHIRVEKAENQQKK